MSRFNYSVSKCAVFLVALIGNAAPIPAADWVGKQVAVLERQVSQSTTGDCSPAIANVGGNVTIVCNLSGAIYRGELTENVLVAAMFRKRDPNDAKCGLWVPAPSEQFIQASARRDQIAEVRTCLEWMSPYKEDGLEMVMAAWTTPIGQCWRCGAASGLTILSKRDGRWTVEADKKGVCYGGEFGNNPARSRLIRIGPARYGVMFDAALCLEKLDGWEWGSGADRYQSIVVRKNDKFDDMLGVRTDGCQSRPLFTFEEGPPDVFFLRYRCSELEFSDGSTVDSEIIYEVQDDGHYLGVAFRKGTIRSDNFVDAPKTR